MLQARSNKAVLPVNNCHQKQNVKVTTVVKHYQQKAIQSKNVSFPNVCLSIPPASRYLCLHHPVFKLVDNYLGSGKGPQKAAMMQRFNNHINNGNKTRSYLSVGNDIGDRCVKNSALPNYHLNESGVHPGCVKPCCQYNRVRTNMVNIEQKNGLRLSLEEAPCRYNNNCSSVLTEIHRIESVQTRAVSEDYVQQLRNEIKSCISNCRHLQEDNQRYAQKLKAEVAVSKAIMSDETRNKINELKNEIYDYRFQPIYQCAHMTTELGRGVPPKPVKQLEQPTAQEKSDLDRCLKTPKTKRNFGSPKTNFEVKLEEANDLIERVRKTLHDIGMGSPPRSAKLRTLQDVGERSPPKTAKPRNCLCKNDKTLLKDIDTHIKEVVVQDLSLTDERVQQKERDKQKDEEERKKLEEELRKKMEEDVRKKMEEDLRKKMEEDLRKKMEKDMRKKMEAELAKHKEAEMQRQLDAALQKQKDELRIEMEEELKKQKQEILYRKQMAEEQEEQLLAKVELRREESVTRKPSLQDGDGKNVEEMEWIPSSDKDFILQKANTFNDDSPTSASPADSANLAEDADKLENAGKFEQVGQFDDGTFDLDIEFEDDGQMEDDAPLEGDGKLLTISENSAENEDEGTVSTLSADVMVAYGGTSTMLCDNKRMQSLPEEPEFLLASSNALEQNVLEPEHLEANDSRPKVSEPKVSQPKLPEPKVSQPKVPEPKVLQPKPPEPKVSQPKLPESYVLQQKVPETHVSQPKVLEAKCCEPKLPEPMGTQPKLPESYVLQQKVPETHLSQPKVPQANGSEPPMSLQSNVTGNESQQKPKLCVQKLPSLSIRGGLVVQKTLNLTIKPTGSATNDLAADVSNIGYEEVKEDGLEGSQVYEEGLKCPEDCKNAEGGCRYKVLEELIDSQIGNNRFKGDISDIPKYHFTEEALILLKSYQILDQNKQHSGDTSNSSMADLSFQLHKYMQQQPYAHKTTESARASTTTLGKASVNNNPSTALGLESNPMLDDLLAEGKDPFDIGFYATKSTQCSGTNLGYSDAPDDFREGYMNEWNAARRASSTDPDSPTLGQRRMTQQQLERFLASDEEVPVRDEPVAVVSSEASSSKRRVSLALDTTVKNASDILADSQTRLAFKNNRERVESENFFQTYNQEPRKSILSQKSTDADAANMVVRTSSSSSSTATSTVHDDPEQPKKKSSSSSSSSSSMFDINDQPRSSNQNKDLETGQQSIGQYAILKTAIQPEKSKEDLKKAEEVPPKKKKSKQEPKPQMLDKELQTSLTSISESTITQDSITGGQINTIKSFIQGLTGGSEEGIALHRSVPSIIRNANKSSTNKDFVTQSMKSSSHNKSELKLKDTNKITRDFEETKEEEELSALDYSIEDQKENENPDDVMKVDELKTENKGRRNDFHTFAKEALAAKRRHSKQGGPTVMTLLEERKNKSLDRGEGNHHRILPFYRRVFNRRMQLDQSQSDPIPIDNSVSEGEITCKSTISSGEVHSCKQGAEPKKSLRNYTETCKKMLGDSPITIARQRTQYNSWMSYYLRNTKHRPSPNDFSFTSSVDTSR